MMKHTPGILLACLLFTPPSAADEIDDIETKLIEVQSRLKSYSAKTNTVRDMDMGQGTSIKTGLDGAVEWLRRGEKILFRGELKGWTSEMTDGKESKTEVDMLAVSDGEVMYKLAVQNGEKKAAKSKIDPSFAQEIKVIMADLKKSNRLALLPDAKIEGRDCVVLEAKPTLRTEGGFSKTVLYFCRETAINIKTIGYDHSGKEVYTFTTTDLKPNVEIKPDRFEFKAPPGVEVIDMTR
jgi:outer membrane lipoprotein-sorting protein